MTLQTLIRSIIIALFFTVSVIALIIPELLPTLSPTFSETRHLLIAGTGIVLYGLDDYISRWKSCGSNQQDFYPCNCH
jgi:hypothetical protein